MNEFQFEALQSYLKSIAAFNYLLNQLIQDYNAGDTENFLEKLKILKTNHSLQEGFLKRLGIITNNKEEELLSEIKELRLLVEEKSENIDLNSAGSYLKNKREEISNIFNKIGIYCFPSLELNAYGTLNVSITVLGDLRAKKEYFKTEEKYNEELEKMNMIKKNMFNNFNVLQENVSIYIKAEEESIEKIKNFIEDLSNEKEYYKDVKFNLYNTDKNEFYINKIEFRIDSIEANILSNKFKNFR